MLQTVCRGAQGGARRLSTGSHACFPAKSAAPCFSAGHLRQQASLPLLQRLEDREGRTQVSLISNCALYYMEYYAKPIHKPFYSRTSFVCHAGISISNSQFTSQIWQTILMKLSLFLDLIIYP